MQYLIAAVAVGLVMAPVAQAEQRAIVQQSPSAQIDAAIAQGKTGVEAALQDASDEPDLARALFERAERRITTGRERVVGALSSWAGCSGRGFKRHDFTVAGVLIARQTVYQNGFCWGAFRITQSDRQSVRRWAALVYCWKDTSSGEYWVRRDPPGPWIRPDVKRAWAQGTIGLNAGGIACGGLRSDHPTITFTGQGRWVSR